MTAPTSTTYMHSGFHSLRSYISQVYFKCPPHSRILEYCLFDRPYPVPYLFLMSTSILIYWSSWDYESCFSQIAIQCSVPPEAACWQSTLQQPSTWARAWTVEGLRFVQLSKATGWIIIGTQSDEYVRYMYGWMTSTVLGARLYLGLYT
jgi:hypothetical protein